MKVSVIIRTYNRAYIIHEALESALAQDYSDIEIIVVDDGSRDSTADVVRNIENEKIRYIRHDQNRGVGAACNSGIRAAKGEVIAFLDSDDLWKTDNIERKVNFLLRHPEVDAVFCDVEITERKKINFSIIGLMTYFPKLLKNKCESEEYIIEGREMFLCLLEEVPIKPSALLFKREMIQKIGWFDETCRSGEDWEFLLRLSRSARFGYIDRPLTIQRTLPDATHVIYREKDKEFLLNLFIREKANLRNDRDALKAVNRGITSHCMNLAWQYLYTGRRRKSLTVYLKGFRETLDPMMLLRAGGLIMPLNIREFVRKILRMS